METIQALEQSIQNRDRDDALRMVESAITLVALSRLASTSARVAAASTIRGMAAEHPGAAEMLTAMASHIEA